MTPSPHVYHFLLLSFLSCAPVGPQLPQINHAPDPHHRFPALPLTDLPLLTLIADQSELLCNPTKLELARMTMQQLLGLSCQFLATVSHLCNWIFLEDIQDAQIACFPQLLGDALVSQLLGDDLKKQIFEPLKYFYGHMK